MISFFFFNFLSFFIFFIFITFFFFPKYFASPDQRNFFKNYSLRLEATNCQSRSHPMNPISFLFFLNSVLQSFQDYFSSYEMGQSVGGMKTGEQENPRKTTWHICKQNLACLTCARCRADTRHSSEMINCSFY